MDEQVVAVAVVDEAVRRRARWQGAVDEDTDQPTQGREGRLSESSRWPANRQHHFSLSHHYITKVTDPTKTG